MPHQLSTVAETISQVKCASCGFHELHNKIESASTHSKSMKKILLQKVLLTALVFKQETIAVAFISQSSSNDI